MLEQLNDYDWGQVFGEGSERDGNCPPLVPDRPPIDKATSVATFGREDVVEIRGISEGERDEQSWIVWGLLRDGRWFIARGSCDCTGWDCRASNGASVASSEEELWRFGMDNAERERFGIALAEDIQ